LPGATTERVRALRVLARPLDGCAEAFLLTLGFKITFLADLVFDGLVTAEFNSSGVVWMRITDLGRKIIAHS
jgi:hypothetical protein